MSSILGLDARVPNLKIVTYSSDKPQLRELLTQGVLAGVAVACIYAMYFSFFIPNYYKWLILGILHKFLGIGAAKGLLSGFAYWCYTRLPQSRFRPVVRFTIAIVVVGIAYVVLELLYPSPPSDQPVVVSLVVVWTALPVISLSISVGSRWRPWRALVYGVGRINTRQRLPTSAIGLVLRVALLFLCFESIYLFVCMIQMNEKLRDFVIMWLIVADFVIGLVIALVNPRFWLTLCLALLINAPWLYILLLYPNEPQIIKIIISGYLLLWCAFLLTRCRTLDPLFSSIRKELRYYYLVD